MDDKEEHKGKITPQKTFDEVANILNFLVKMAYIQVDKFLKENNPDTKTIQDLVPEKKRDSNLKKKNKII